MKLKLVFQKDMAFEKAFNDFHSSQKGPLWDDLLRFILTTIGLVLLF